MTFAQSCQELMKSNRNHLEDYGEGILDGTIEERLARAKDELEFLKSDDMREVWLEADWGSCHMLPPCIRDRITDLENGIKILEGGA